MKKQKLLNITIVSIIVCVAILLLFSYKLQAMENDNSIVSEETSNNNRVYIMGNDTQLLYEYNMSRLQKEHEQKIEQAYYDRVKTMQSTHVMTLRSSVKFKSVTEADKDDKYTEDDLLLLAKLIQGEAGSDFITDLHQQLVGCVVMNRVNHDGFPDTIKEVIFEKGQYQCVRSKSFNDTPSQRAMDNAKLVLEGEVDCPKDVVFQAEFKQGKGTYKKIKTIISTTYFCHD